MWTTTTGACEQQAFSTGLDVQPLHGLLWSGDPEQLGADLTKGHGEVQNRGAGHQHRPEPGRLCVCMGWEGGGKHCGHGDGSTRPKPPLPPHLKGVPQVGGRQEHGVVAGHPRARGRYTVQAPCGHNNKQRVCGGGGPTRGAVSSVHGARGQGVMWGYEGKGMCACAPGHATYVAGAGLPQTERSPWRCYREVASATWQSHCGCCPAWRAHLPEQTQRSRC